MQAQYVIYTCMCMCLVVHLLLVFPPPLSLSLSLSSHSIIILFSSKLNPKLTPADQFDIIKASTDSVYPLPSPLAASLNGGKKKSEPLFVSLSIHSLHHNHQCLLYSEY